MHVAGADLAAWLNVHPHGIGSLIADRLEKQIDLGDVDVRCSPQREGDLLGKAVGGIAFEHANALGSGSLTRPTVGRGGQQHSQDQNQTGG